MAKIMSYTDHLVVFGKIIFSLNFPPLAEGFVVVGFVEICSPSLPISSCGQRYKSMLIRSFIKLVCLTLISVVNLG
jgi:hypothetical protein